ncbi:MULTISPECIES: DUF4339 domain-containing protein [unclassified Mesorhizobium]|uniref:DUF4339 domain-containing protein n=1 Tax=unclassified Mesorhizobium TaxID=325217 RepID=UPI0003CF2E3D|nr:MULTISPECIES: DUF4339 domain-containing protein [unclassified Mesorhizobium]ESY51405.1 hypothetical protein X745_23930 [Mesorhizobium sp. LNJC374B00]ESY56840.1 hypothetical protein X744_21050 [Mesorhizobium sp. LNJC372A00]WJI81993.1 DUF4339 domain-containing protein [Mesorhizobium sp. C374B]WJI88512.1 DUF4339 domain-containing protein [Mesorhizobium sp. C372A]
MSLWFYERDGKSIGPVDESELARIIAAGEVDPETRVWTAEFGTEWKVANQTRLFSDGLSAPPLPQLVEPPQLAPTIRSPTAKFVHPEPSEIYAYLLAGSPLLITVLELAAWFATGNLAGGALAAVYIGATLATLVLALRDRGELVKTGLAKSDTMMVGFVLLTPLIYFLRRAAVINRSAQKYIWIWLISLGVSFMASPETIAPKLAFLTSAQTPSPSPSPSPSASAARVGHQPSKPKAEIDRQVLDDLGSSIVSCWTLPADAKRPASVSMRLLPTGELDGRPTEITAGLASTRADEALPASAVRAVLKCAPYADFVAKSPELAGNDLIVTLDPVSISSRVQLAEAEQSNATGTMAQADTNLSNPAKSQVDQKLPPYNDMRELFFEHALLLTNPLTAREAEEKLRQRGVSQMTAFVADYTEETSSWLVQLAAEVGTALTPGKGFFCRVSVDDEESMARLRLVSAIRPGIVISGEVGEYNVDIPNGVMSIVLDPCRIVDIPPQ